MQWDVEAVDVNVHALETVHFDRLFQLLQRLLDAKWIVARKADEACWIAGRVLRDFFELGVHVHPLVSVRPHFALGDEDFVDAGLVHLSDHRLDAVVLRQTADGLFHTADELALFCLVPLGDEFRGGDVVHEIDGLNSVSHGLLESTNG